MRSGEDLGFRRVVRALRRQAEDKAQAQGVELTEQDIRLAREALEAVNRKRARNGRGPVAIEAPDLQIIAQAIADARQEGWRSAVDRVGPETATREGR